MFEASLLGNFVHRMAENYQMVVGILGIASAIKVWLSKLKLPPAVQRIVGNRNALQIAMDAVRAAAALAGKTDAERREYAVAFLRTKLQTLLSMSVADNVANLVVEFAWAKVKAGKR